MNKNLSPVLYIKYIPEGEFYLAELKPFDGATIYHPERKNEMLTINKEKFLNHLCHFLAQETIPHLEKNKDSDNVEKMNSIKINGGWGKLQEIYSWRDLHELSDLGDFSALRDLSDLGCLSDIRDISALCALRDLRDISALSALRDLRVLCGLSDLRNINDLSDLSGLSDLRGRYEEEFLAAYVYAVSK